MNPKNLLDVMYFLLIVFLCFAANTATAEDLKPHLTIQVLDKMTASPKQIEIKSSEPIEIGNLRIRARRCHKSSPEEVPESTAYLEVWEDTPHEESQLIFEGWVFSSMPSSLDHPVYDLRLLQCHACTTCCKQEGEGNINILPPSSAVGSKEPHAAPIIEEILED